MATSVAATAALVLAGAAPALAEHVEFDDPFEFPSGDFSNNNPDCEDFGLTPPPDTEDGKVDPPVDVDNEFFTADVSDDTTELDVTAKGEFVITAVIVKGGEGGGGTAYFHPPFQDLTTNPSAQEISHYNICGFVDEDDETPPPDDDETPPPDDDETPPPDDEDVKDDDDEKPEVPTEVPAGHEGSSGGITAGTLGLIAAATALVAGAAALVRRRFVNGS